MTNPLFQKLIKHPNGFIFETSSRLKRGCRALLNMLHSLSYLENLNSFCIIVNTWMGKQNWSCSFSSNLTQVAQYGISIHIGPASPRQGLFSYRRLDSRGGRRSTVKGWQRGCLQVSVRRGDGALLSCPGGGSPPFVGQMSQSILNHG